VSAQRSRFRPGNRVGLLRSGREYFPELVRAIEAAEREVWLETYIFADDPAGRMVADALVRAAQRGVVVRVLVDGWGARHYLTPPLERRMLDGGVDLLRYRPDIAPWNFRSNRLRRLHRKLCHVDGRVGFVGGIKVIDALHTPGHKPPRVDFAVRLEGPVLAPIIYTMQRVWAIVEISQLRRTDVQLFPGQAVPQKVGTQVAKFVVRDNLRHRSDIERAYMAAIRTARQEIVIATAYFFPGAEFRHALIAAAARGVKVTLLLQARVEYRLLHHACRALYGQLLLGNVSIHEYHRSFLHAKVAVVDDRWATVGSSNIDPYSFLMAREANVFVRDPYFADQLRDELMSMIETGARPVQDEQWRHRSRFAKALTWVAYGVVRVAMGMLRYGGNEWWRGRG
jgi:cardiolipin synthase